MKSSTQDKAEGKNHQAKGKVKEVTGKVTDTTHLEAKGKKIAGKKKIGKGGKDVENKRAAH